MNNPKKKLRKQFCLQHIEKNKILRNKLNQGSKRCVHWKPQKFAKRTKDDISKHEDILCPWIGRFNIIKMSVLSKEIYRFNSKIPITFFGRNKKTTLKFIWNFQWPLITKTILKKNIRVLTVIKTVWYWHKDRHTNQWNRIRSLEMNLCIHGQMIFDEGVNIQWGKDRLFNKQCWKNWISINERKNLNPYFILSTKINTNGSKNFWRKTFMTLDQ